MGLSPFYVEQFKCQTVTTQRIEHVKPKTSRRPSEGHASSNILENNSMLGKQELRKQEVQQ